MDLFGVGGGPNFGAILSMDMCLPGYVCFSHCRVCASVTVCV